MKRLSIWLAVVAMLVGASNAMAQTGTVTGTVVDQNGMPVENARVCLMDSDGCGGGQHGGGHGGGGCMHTVNPVMTDANGVYVFENVPVDTYTARAMKRGLGCARSEEFTVVDGQTTELPPLALSMDGCGGGMDGGKIPPIQMLKR